MASMIPCVEKEKETRRCTVFLVGDFALCFERLHWSYEERYEASGGERPLEALGPEDTHD